MRLGKEDGQRRLTIELEHKITKLFGACELVLLQPLLQQVLLILLQHGPHELYGLNSIELPYLKESRKVLQQRAWLPLHCRQCLEASNRVRIAKIDLVEMTSREVSRTSSFGPSVRTSVDAVGSVVDSVARGLIQLDHQ